MVYWCMPLFLPYFLSSFYHFLSFSPFYFYSKFLTTILLWVVFLTWVFSLLDPPLLVFTTLLLWVFSLRCLRLLWVPFFQCFSLFPYFSSHSLSPFLPWLPSFYSELIQWDFSLLPLGLHQLFLVCCGHPFKITHSPIGCPCHCSVHVCCNTTHFTTKFPFVCSCCIPLPLGD